MEHSNIIQRCVLVCVFVDMCACEYLRGPAITKKNVPQNIDRPKLLHEC
jgi:hypothetical protein